MPLIARQRSRLATLAVLALVGSLLAVSAAPAAAAGDDKVSNEAKYSACIGDATADAGFTDMVGNFAEGAANCLAYYGITAGRGDGTMFDPGAPITRAQMALFMSKAAGLAGATLAEPTSQGLTDVDDESIFGMAINQVVAAGIMTKRTDTTFDLYTPVKRWEMAAHLSALLDAAIVGPGGTDIAETTTAKMGILPANLDKDVFGDIGFVPASAHGAILNLYEMGVASGTGDGTTFSPNAEVRRDQMAAFITRALDHTNARPAGLSVQSLDLDVFEAESVSFVASVRGTDFMPVSGALVDLFHAKGDDARTTAFKDDGTCITSPTGGTSPCKITASDEATDAVGNIESNLSVTMASATTAVVWLWTGNVNDTFDDDTTASQSFDVVFMEDAAAMQLTDNLPPDIDRSYTAPAGDPDADPSTAVSGKHGAQIKYGDPLTLTVQLIDDAGNAVAKKDVGITVTVRIREDQGDDTGNDELGVDSGANQTSFNDTSDTTDVHKTDESGRVELTFTQSDPNPGTGNNDATRMVIHIAGVGTLQDGNGAAVGVVDAGGNAVATIGGNDAHRAYEWNDDTAEATTLTVKAPMSYTPASAVAPGASASARATLTDQYGVPIGRKNVEFYAGANVNGLPVVANAIKRQTGPTNGVASLGWNRNSATGIMETITARYDKSATATPVYITSTAMFYWTVTGNVDTAGDIVVADADNNTLVVMVGSVPTSGTYDSGDHFFLTKDRPDPDNPGQSVRNKEGVTMAEFEVEVKTTNDADWTFVSNAISSFHIVVPAG